MEKVIEAKSQHRSDIDPNQWNKCRAYLSNFPETTFYWKESVERRSSETLSVDEFRMSYESANRPLVIEGEISKWPAYTKWTFSYFESSIPEIKLKCGETDSGSPVRLKFKHFFKYLNTQTDDSPLYVFDDSFDTACGCLLEDYTVPKYFPEDFFEYVPHRPPFRWLLIGPKRSGSLVHQDPLGTSAWNASLAGYKLWALFPPWINKAILKGCELYKPQEDKEPFFWFKSVLPRIQQKHGINPLIIIQKPGDLVFVPSKWWHTVLNITNTIAVTQNFVSSVNFDSVWRTVKQQRRKLFKNWKKNLHKTHYKLWKRGIALDKLDDKNNLTY